MDIVSREMDIVNREWFTRAQAAQYLGVPKRYLDRLAMVGAELPYYRLGKLTRYTKADLDKWLESKKVNNAIRVDQDEKK